MGRHPAHTRCQICSNVIISFRPPLKDNHCQIESTTEGLIAWLNRTFHSFLIQHACLCFRLNKFAAAVEQLGGMGVVDLLAAMEGLTKLEAVE